MPVKKSYTYKQITRAVKWYERMTDEQILDLVRLYAKAHDRPPNKNDIPGAYYIKKRLDPWPRVLEKAGVKAVSEVYERRAKVRREKYRTQKEKA